jgi:tRNA-2-methylthio-N6-dimethylallyladenosine synthase
MNRGYTSQQYRDFIDRARSLMPDISIASDFIVGFPTETEADHQSTLDLIRYCGFKNSFIFKYSPRPGTVAIDRFEDDVDEDTKRRRNNEMLAVQQEVSMQHNSRLVGQTVEVMVEGESKLVSRQKRAVTSNIQLGWEKSSQATALAEAVEVKTQLVGRTRGDQVVCFNGEQSLKGQLLQVQITSAQNLTLFGELSSPS